jgi:hypothetical protein
MIIIRTPVEADATITDRLRESQLGQWDLAEKVGASRHG